MKISVATLRGYRRLFGGKIPAGAMEQIRKEYRRLKNPGAGAFKRCVEKVAAQGNARSPRGVCATAARKKYGSRRLQKMAAAGRRKAKRSNPVAEAAKRYEFFHGQAPTVDIEVETPVVEHSVLSGIGKLMRLVIIAVDGKHLVTLEGFKGALLAQDEKGKQLYIEGGNQAVNLADFGVTRAHEQEILGAVKEIVYHTVKVHLRPEDGGDADYNHKFGKQRAESDGTGDHHVKITGGRLPLAVYNVRSKLIMLAGGTYDLPEVGIRG